MAPGASAGRSPPGTSDMTASRHEVDEGEDEDPHEVDEAPVEAQQLDLVRGGAAAEVLREDGGDVDDADEDVEPVEPGDDVERAGPDRPPEHEPLADEPAPLARLSGEEEQAPQRGDREQRRREAPLVL